MKFATTITTALAVAGASANMHKGYSQHRPEKHQVARTPRLLQQASNNNHAFKSPKFSVTATSNGAEKQQSAIGGATVSAFKITSATGTFRVPEARQPTRGPTGNNPITYGASFWVGIDGTGACTAAALRAGVDIFWDPEGTSYNAWYQLATGRSVDFAGPLNAEPGDTVRVTANAGSVNGTVSVTFENLSTGLQSTQTLDDDGAVGKLCRSQASWLVEDFVLEQSTGLPVPLVDFDNATFSNMAVMAAGETGGATPSQVDINRAVLVNIEQDQQGGKLTDCSPNGTELVCKRTYGTA
ncbi:hypothetical protein RB595_010741 [Gaeumannomyces hyphopodioides]